MTEKKSAYDELEEMVKMFKKEACGRKQAEQILCEEIDYGHEG